MIRAIAVLARNVALLAIMPLLFGVLGAHWAARSIPERGPVGGHTVTLLVHVDQALARVVEAAGRVDERAARVEELADAISGGDPVARDRADSLRCFVLHLATTIGKRRILSSGQWSTRAAPSATSWKGWTPEELESCAVCSERYECNPALRRGGRR